MTRWLMLIILAGYKGPGTLSGLLGRLRKLEASKWQKDKKGGGERNDATVGGQLSDGVIVRRLRQSLAPRLANFVLKSYFLEKNYRIK